MFGGWSLEDVVKWLAAGWIAGLSWFARKLVTDIETKTSKEDFEAELKLANSSRARLHDKLDAMSRDLSVVSQRVARIEGRIRGV